MKKIFIVAEIRNWLNQYLREEITFSRFVEMLNEKASMQPTETERKAMYNASIKHIIPLIGHHVSANDMDKALNSIVDSAIGIICNPENQEKS